MLDTVPAISATDPLQDKAEPISHVWCLWGKIFKKGQKTPDRERISGKRGVRSSRGNTKVRGGKGGGAPGTGAKIFLQPMDKPCQSRQVFLEELPPVERLCQSREKGSLGGNVREKPLCTVQPYPPALLEGASRAVRTERVMLNLRKGEEKVLL